MGATSIVVAIAARVRLRGVSEARGFWSAGFLKRRVSEAQGF